MFSLSSPRFVCKNNGVLFENQLLQIGLKSEFRQNLGKSCCTVVGCLHYQSQCQHDIPHSTHLPAVEEGNSIVGLSCFKLPLLCIPGFCVGSCLLNFFYFFGS